MGVELSILNTETFQLDIFVLNSIMNPLDTLYELPNKPTHFGGSVKKYNQYLHPAVQIKTSRIKQITSP